MNVATNLFYAGRVLNLAHRGASAESPENTLPAFQLAAEQGADGVELDVQLSADGHAVIIHDFSLDKTTTGHGPVSRHTLAELKTLDAGRHFSPDYAGTPIPTLAELFTMLGPVLLFNLELKTTSPRPAELVGEVIRLVEDFDLTDRVVLSSFNPLALWQARRLNPAIKRGLLWAPQGAWYLRRQLLRPLAQPAMFHPYWEAVTAPLVAQEHQHGHLVNVWTCNEPAAMRRLIQLGVDAIMTDHPKLLKDVLHDTATH